MPKNYLIATLLLFFSLTARSQVVSSDSAITTPLVVSARLARFVDTTSASSLDEVRIVTNLLTNAFKFMPENGRVAVRMNFTDTNMALVNEPV